MKKIKLITLLLLAGANAYCQSVATLNLDTCYALAKKNFPLLKKMALIDKTEAFSIDNASKAYLPQFNLVGQATYQSEVTKIPISLPGMQIQELNKDQYRLYGELSQSLTEPLIIKQQKSIITANTVHEKQKLEVELFKLKERINQLYFGILLIDAQLEQTNLLEKDIELALKKTDAAILNGVSLKSNADMLKAELLKIAQRNIELMANRKAYTDMLSLFINRTISENETLQIPSFGALSSTINRPEMKQFEAQKRSVEAQKKLLSAKNLPKLSLFFQGGYGRPTLNALSNDFGAYYIGGLRFNWNITSYYTYKNDKQLLFMNENNIDIQKEVFLFNTQLLLKQQNGEISKLIELINTDKQIISLREKIKTTSNVQLENGTITAIDYLNTLNACDQAKQNLAIHKIQLLLAQHTFQTTSGN